MNQKKAIGFGFRGWMLILYLALAYITYQAFTQYPLNILSDFYGGAGIVSKIYSICAIVGIFIQLLLVGPLSRMKSIKAFGSILGAITLVLAFGVMSLPKSALWYVCYAIVNVTSVLYATLSLGILVGQWFPTRKGTVMGIATLAFPVANGLLGPFAGSVFGGVAGKVAETAGALMATNPEIGGAAFGLLEQGNIPGAAAAAGVNATAVIQSAFLPFFIASVIGWVIGLIFIKDYPEQVGAYRDNDKNITKEVADAIMMAEIENKKTSVWTIPHMFASKDFWCATLVNASLLGCAIGVMSQSNAIIKAVNPDDGFYNLVMALVMIFGCVGSFVLGLIDTHIGTKKAMTIATIIMLVAGILGCIPGSTTLLIAMIFVSLFMGAASNFGVSCAAQYWRMEDFGRVFTLSSPIGSLISSATPMIVAALLFGPTGYKGHGSLFLLIAIVGAVATVLMLCFSPKNIAKVDNKLREEAGKPVDDALAGRK